VLTCRDGSVSLPEVRDEIGEGRLAEQEGGGHLHDGRDPHRAGGEVVRLDVLFSRVVVEMFDE
jgi:hypothetical protein